MVVPSVQSQTSKLNLKNALFKFVLDFLLFFNLTQVLDTDNTLVKLNRIKKINK